MGHISRKTTEPQKKKCRKAHKKAHRHRADAIGLRKTEAPEENRSRAAKHGAGCRPGRGGKAEERRRQGNQQHRAPEGIGKGDGGKYIGNEKGDGGRRSAGEHIGRPDGEKLSIAPVFPEGLTWARGSRIVGGRKVTVSWKRENGAVTLQTSVADPED